MALTVVTINAIGSEVEYELLDSSDTLDIIQGVSVIDTGANPAIDCTGSGGANDTIQIAGQVVGSDGIETSQSNSYGNIYVASTGSVTGDTGDGLNLSGNFSVTNYGQIEGVNDGISGSDGVSVVNYGSISGNSAFANGIYSAEQGTIYNYGTVEEGVYFGSNSAANYLYNSGTISGGGIYDASTNTINTDNFYNAGSIEGYPGNSSFYGGFGSAIVDFWNSGSMYGSINLGSGTNNFNSTLGYVYGAIYAGAGNSVIIGAINGGTVDGSSGNDVLYANPTLTAAQDASHTTLDGETGNNWEYGDGAYTTFDSGDNAKGTYNQIFGEPSQMEGVAGDTNNTLSYAGLSSAYKSAYIDLLHGDAYMCTIANANGAPSSDLVFEDYLKNVPNVIGTSGSDVILCDNGADKITSGANTGGDIFYAGSGANSQDMFAFTSLSESPLSHHDAIEGFKVGTDKVDLSALDMPIADVLLSYGGSGANTIYIEKNPSAGFNSATDMILSVKASTNTAMGYGDLIL
jgi:hypothetical protein